MYYLLSSVHLYTGNTPEKLPVENNPLCLLIFSHKFKKILCVHAEQAESLSTVSNNEMQYMRILNS